MHKWPPSLQTLSLGLLLLATTSYGLDPIPKNQRQSAWYQAGEARVKTQPFFEPSSKTTTHKAKNIIVFIGDGMGVSTVTAARILQGQQLGLDGEEHVLSFEKMPFTAMSKTYNVDAQTPDSAGTMTAIITGVKTDAGVLSVSEAVKHGQCDTLFGNELVSALELAEIAGRSTGIVSTARITHATPAATYAKSVNRDWEDDSQLPQEAKDAGCKDIASQLVHFEKTLKANYPTAKNINGLEVVLGGGRRHFLPNQASFNSSDTSNTIEGTRQDGRNLIQQWQKLYPDGQYIFDQAGFDKINPKNTQHLFGLMNETHMQYESERANDIAGEPSLSEMTDKAIDILANNNKGYFLMVEAGRIDHAHHAGNAFNALTDTIEFAKTVEKTLAKVDLSETLVLLTADHSHVFTIAGYPKRGNPILGKVVGIGKTDIKLAQDKRPYTTLGYANGPGFDHDKKKPAHGGRPDLTEIDTTHSSFHQEALVPLESETHGGEDVTVYGQGPGAENIVGILEQNVIFHILNHAGQLEADARKAL